MSTSFEFLSPDHFTAGAVGQPGQRIFYLQSREKGQLVTLKSGMTLSDNPGILWPTMDGDATLRLAFGGALPDTAMDYENVAVFGAEFLAERDFVGTAHDGHRVTVDSPHHDRCRRTGLAKQRKN